MTIKINDLEYELKEQNDKLFISNNELERLSENNNLLIQYKLMDLKIDGLIDDETKIIIDDVTYYDINLVLLMLKNNNELIKEIILAIPDKKYIWEYIIDSLGQQEAKKNIDYIYNYIDLFESFYEVSENNSYCYRTEYYTYQDAKYYLKLLANVKKKINDEKKPKRSTKNKPFYYFEVDDSLRILSKDFGTLKEDVDFKKIIENAYPDIERPTLAQSAASLLYTIIMEKPFVAYNYEAAAIMTLDYLDLNNAIYRRDKSENFINPHLTLNVSSSDLMYAIKLVEDNKRKKKADVIKKIVPLFGMKKISYNYEKKQMLAKLKENPTKDEIYRYIVYFTEHYHGYQGYYEYYKGGSIVYKIHYHGEYTSFKFNILKSLDSHDTLVFDCEAHAYTEGPTDLLHRAKVIALIYEEIKRRSYDDILNDYFKELKMDLKQLYDPSIKIEFNLKWDYEIDPDYEW